jgi:hypothetical protein
LTTKEVVVVKPSENSSASAEENNKEEEGEVERSDAAAKAKEAGLTFTEMIKTLGKKAVTKTEEKTKEIKDRSIEAMDIGTQKKTKDIQALGIHADNVVLVYERIMFEIEREELDLIMLFEISFGLEFFSTGDTFKILTEEVKFICLQLSRPKTT